MSVYDGKLLDHVGKLPVESAGVEVLFKRLLLLRLVCSAFFPPLLYHLHLGGCSIKLAVKHCIRKVFVVQ